MRKIIFLLSLLLQGCSDGFVHKEQIVGNYYLTALELKQGMTLSYNISNKKDVFIGVVNPTVFALGNNDNFIIVKQHPEKSAYKSDNTLTNYYIIPLKEPIIKSPEKNVIGPMTKEEFEEMRVELEMPESLNFTKVFEDLM